MRKVGRRCMTPFRTGLSYIAKGHHPRRVLVVVGDGGDNASTTTFDQVLKEAQASNAAIYTVGIIDPLEREANPRLLKRLAAATGGDSFLPRDVNDVDDVLQRSPDDIRHSYTLGYVSSNSARDGQFRRIRVVVTDPARRALRVRTRDGYRAGGPAGAMRSMGASRNGSGLALDRAWPRHRRSHVSAVGGSDVAVGARVPGRAESLPGATCSLSRPARGRSQRRMCGDPVLNPRPRIGRLEIPRIGLSVVVAEGDDENTLEVAVGHYRTRRFPGKKETARWPAIATRFSGRFDA